MVQVVVRDYFITINECVKGRNLEKETEVEKKKKTGYSLDLLLIV